MENRSIFAVVVIAVLVLIVITTSGQTRSPQYQTWEYKTAYSRCSEFFGEKTFNELGAQGWELVAAAAESDSAGATYVFKRPR